MEFENAPSKPGKIMESQNFPYNHGNRCAVTWNLTSVRNFRLKSSFFSCYNSKVEKVRGGKKCAAS